MPVGHHLWLIEAWAFPFTCLGIEFDGAVAIFVWQKQVADNYPKYG